MREEQEVTMKSCAIRSSFEEAKERLTDEDGAQEYSLMDGSDQLGLIAVAHNSTVEFYTLDRLQLVHSKEITGETITALRFVPHTVNLACAVFPMTRSNHDQKTQGRQITGRTCIYKVGVHEDKDLPVTCHLQRVYHVRGPQQSVTLSITPYLCPQSGKEEVILYHKFKKQRHFVCRFSPKGGSLCDDEVEEITAVGKDCSDLAFGIDRVVAISFASKRVGPLYDGGFRAISKPLVIHDAPRSVELIGSNKFAVVVSKGSHAVLRLFRAVDADIEPLQDIALGTTSACSSIYREGKWQGFVSVNASEETGLKIRELSGFLWNVNGTHEIILRKGRLADGIRGNTLLGCTVVSQKGEQGEQIVTLTEKELGVMSVNLNDLPTHCWADLAAEQRASDHETKTSKRCKKSGIEGNTENMSRAGNPNKTVKDVRFNSFSRAKSFPMHSIFAEVRDLKARLDTTQGDVKTLKADFAAFTQEVTTFMEQITRELHQAGARPYLGQSGNGRLLNK